MVLDLSKSLLKLHDIQVYTINLNDIDTRQCTLRQSDDFKLTHLEAYLLWTGIYNISQLTSSKTRTEAEVSLGHIIKWRQSAAKYIKELSWLYGSITEK